MTTILREAPRTPTLAEVVQAGVDAALERVYTALPGRVERYDAATQKADVKPLIKTQAEDELGNLTLQSMPIVTNVPIMFPGGGGFRVTFPIKKGDTVLLVFSMRPLDKWLGRGGEVDPGDHTTRHNLTDAFAIPGLRDFAHALAAPPGNCATLGIEGGTFEGAGLGESIHAHLVSLKAWMDLHSHVVSTVPSTSAISLPASPAVPTLASETAKVSR